MECEIKLEGPISPDVEPGKEETEESKKRKRKPYRPGEALGWEMGWGGVAHQSLVASQLQLCLLLGIGGFMVRQRKSHTRVKKGPAAQAEVLSGDGQPDEGETGEGSIGVWEKVGVTGPIGHCQGGPGGGFTQRAERVVGLVAFGEESMQKASSGQLGSSMLSVPREVDPSSLFPVMPADLPAEGSVEQSPADAEEKKKQQRRGRKKSKLEDMFPAYLQVGLRL